MRILFTGPASAGHLFPMVPTAQALQAAGHHVLFAGSAPLDQLRQTGLPTAEIGDGSTLMEAFRRASHGTDPQFVNDGSSPEDMERLAASGFAEHGRVTIEDLLALATAWRPDLIVHAAFQAAAPLVSAALGIPAVVHNFGVMSGLGMVGRLAGLLDDEYRARDLQGPATRTVLDVVPASLGGDGTGWRVRYVPYNGGGTVPSDLLARGSRPRIAVTLGTVVTAYAGVNPVARLVSEAASVDADFLLAVGDTDLSPLGTLPSNVRALPWVPLAQLLDTADAVVHHGGSGTMLTAAARGVPQLILPQGADHFINVDAATGLGFALRASDESVDAALLSRLLTDDDLRKAAATTQADIGALPSPADLVASFEALG
ncbi:glycosyltransferase [Streptomyces sp. NBC_00503]|uniref:glycosyltransferase n=1 Tax=Streptomyces sp. NBC_00503 TaxID=2903659 RepID=UPI002E81645C|nr:glycosyltransferase [Streptomyces sp. NBC_00503]WUD79317.1 glycosyltransferase [Streptomyces sp. NBC_00503]